MVVPIVWYGYCQKLWLMCGNAVRCISHTILEFIEIEASTNAACYKKNHSKKCIFTLREVRSPYCSVRHQILHSHYHFHQTCPFVMLNACKKQSKQTKPCFTITKNMCIDAICFKNTREKRKCLCQCFCTQCAICMHI